ncbi:DUF1819 family protein [Candidatus Bipolaricaulota bacterium]
MAGEELSPMTDSTLHKEYVMSFTAGALLRRESGRLAEMHAHRRDWSVVRQQALEENALQAKTTNSAKRLIREIVGRLETLSDEQLELLTSGSEDEQRHILWLAICKRYRLIWDFAVEVLRERYLLQEGSISRNDYESFFTAKAAWHPELEALGASTRDRQRQNLFKMLREARHITEQGEVVGSFLSPAVIRVLVQDSIDNLMIFPVHKEDVERWARQ